MMQDTIISLENVSFAYPESSSQALSGVTLSVRAGECVVLCGKSGCGKTTVTRLLNGLIPNFYHGEMSGRVSLFGADGRTMSVEDLVPLVGSVFQNPKTQYFHTNTSAEMAFPCENTGMPREEILERVASCSEKFQIQSLMDRNIFHLSGGEKQKVAVGAASILNPRLMVLDEPTSNLDQQGIDQLAGMITTLKKEGVTIVMAEHRLAWTKDFADTYLYFEDGDLAETYTREEFFHLPEKALEERGLRTTELAPYREHLEQRRITCKDRECSDIRLQLQNLTIGYKKNKPVYHLAALSARPGEVVGIMGHNGIGKTTLIRTIAGLIKPLDGCILWDGKRCRRSELMKKCFLVMQDVNYQLFSDSVRDELLMDAQNEAACEQVMEDLGLSALADRHPMSLSGGQKQRVAIGSAMVSAKEIIILDEPTSGLDRYHMNQVGRLIRRLKELNKLILVITHDEELAADWCDVIYKLEDDHAL